MLLLRPPDPGRVPDRRRGQVGWDRPALLQCGVELNGRRVGDRESEVELTESTESVDPDVDLRVGSQRRELVRSHASLLGAIALGGGLGAIARYGVNTLLPTRPGQFPWGTFTINVLGCFLIGVLMVLITEVWSAHRLVRPFLGVGVLGGFTTFSTYAVEIRDLVRPGSVGVAFGYLAGTLIGAMLAVLAGVWLTRAAAARRGEVPRYEGQQQL